MGRWYEQPEYEPLWAAAQDLGMPLSLHTNTNRPGTPQELETYLPIRNHLSFAINNDYWPRMSLTHMIFSGVFERYPRLQVGAIEFELSWVPNFLDRLDYNYTQRIRGERYRFKEDMTPREYFHRNVFLGFQEDVLGMRDREIIGVDNILWGSDYPHVESTFPTQPGDPGGHPGRLHRRGKGQDRGRQRRPHIPPGLGRDCHRSTGSWFSSL